MNTGGATRGERIALWENQGMSIEELRGGTTNAVNFALIPYYVLRDFDSPPKPRWMKWISIETQVFGERDMKGSP